MSRQIMQDWERRCSSREFCLDYVLRDHVNGGHLFPILSNTVAEFPVGTAGLRIDIGASQA